MKYLFAIIITIVNISCLNAQKKQTAESTLKMVHQSLNNLKSLSYNLERESSYPDEDYHNISNWNCYFDFKNENNLLWFRFQIDEVNFKTIYNGTEYFELNKEDKTSEIENQPELEDIDGRSYFYNSLITIRKIIPIIIADKSIKKTIKDTIIANKSYTVISINVGNRRMQNLGKEFNKMDEGFNYLYDFIIDKKSKLPFQIIQKSPGSKNFIKTTFTNINLKPTPPKENSWFYSNYSKEYKPLEEVTINHLKIGESAPKFSLPIFEGDKNASLQDYNGKVILLDFWIKNCSQCILSVPHLNELQKKYKNEDFEIISINAYDSIENITFFKNKYGVQYPILINGKEVAIDFGVRGFPAYFIIDKNGKIVMNQEESSFEKLEVIINNELLKK